MPSSFPLSSRTSRKSSTSERPSGSARDRAPRSERFFVVAGDSLSGSSRNLNLNPRRKRNGKHSLQIQKRRSGPDHSKRDRRKSGRSPRRSRRQPEHTRPVHQREQGRP